MSRLARQKRYPPRACAVSRARQRGAALLPRPPFLRHATTDEASAAQAFSMATPELTSDLVHGPVSRQAASRRVTARLWHSSQRLVASMLGLVILVIGLGAWTRLVDAGLGCPDWPGCYGALVVPDAQTASLHSPHHPLEGYKAWAEMIHRYAASLLGLAAIALLALGWRIRRREAHQPQAFEGGSGEAKVTDHWGAEVHTRFPLAGCWLLLGMLLVQGAFGAFTVTLKLWPQVVTLHLLGGLSVLSLLLLLWLSLRRRAAHLKVTAEQHKAGAYAAHIRRQPWLATLAAALLLGQLALGGWTSSNYAGLACEGFPTCNGAAWPAMDWGEGFHLTQDVGPSYLHGQLHGEARTAIHMAHRGGAVLLGAVLLALYWRQRRYLPARTPSPHNPWRWALGCWLVQAGLGVANVLWWLPLDLALAHTLGAVALTLAMVWAMDQMRQAARHKRASVSQALA
ncbi:COX15/CtaA family protein [Cobetia sp. 29-18-1]|nr:COX15/CtaA family protein [Cobetia sp. 29-18-1]MDH2298500.1 COX15/CtaA family protein [Cobetia sp. 29-18-1]